MIDLNKVVNPASSVIMDAFSSIKTEEDYHMHPGIGNSDLKLLEKSPRTFKQEKLLKEKEESPYEDLPLHFKMGTMIEQKLLEPDRFEENFVEREFTNSPSSPNQKGFVDMILEGATPREAYRSNYSVSSYSEERLEGKAQSLYQTLKNYIEFQEKAKGKGVFDKDEKTEMLNSIADIMSHKRASRFLCEDEKWDFAKSQVPMFREYKGVLCKGLIDRLVIKNKSVFVVDLKTTKKNLNSFSYYFGRWKYYRQFAHYLRLAKWYVKEFIPLKKIGINDVNFVPVVVATRRVDPYGTIVKTVPDEFIRKGEEELDILLDLFKWHAEKKHWDRPKSYFKKGLANLKYDESGIIEMSL